MKSSSMTGFTEVFKFTYAQSIKSKATKITMIIFMVIALASFPVMSLIGNDSADESKVESISKVYIYENGIEISDTVTNFLSNNESYKDIQIEVVNAEKMKNLKDNILNSEESKEILIDIECILDVKDSEYGINYNVFYGKNSAVDRDEVDKISEYFSGMGEAINLANLGINEETAEFISNYIEYKVFGLDADGNIVTDAISEAQYMVNYAILMVCLLCITFAGSKVAEQIVTEKATKVIEYIMTSVKPMAIITGKVIASVAIVLTILGGTLAAFIASGFINGIMNSSSEVGFMMPELITNFFNQDVVKGANIYTVVISLVIFLEGFLFYGFIAGVSGAMVSKIEELAEGMKLYTFIMIIGAYLALGLIMSSSMGSSGWGVGNYIVYFLPMSSPFIVPSYMLFGKITPLMGLGIIVVNAILIALLAWFVSTIYEQLIYYNGNKLKIKDLFKLSKNGRRSK